MCCDGGAGAGLGLGRMVFMSVAPDGFPFKAEPGVGPQHWVVFFFG